MTKISSNNSQLIRFARASSHIADLNCKLRNFLNKAIAIINFAKPFLIFIDDTMILYLNSILDLKNNFGYDNFSAQFIKIISL